MLKAAINKGQSSEKVMWQSVDAVESLLESVKDNDPDAYWQFVRDTHESLYGHHYDEEFARYDVAQLHYTDRQRVPRHGAHWTPEEVDAATAGFSFPQGITKWDKFVAMNVTYSDLNKALNDEEVLKAGHAFWFMDEDWSEQGSACKIWDYTTYKMQK